MDFDGFEMEKEKVPLKLGLEEVRREESVGAQIGWERRFVENIVEWWICGGEREYEGGVMGSWLDRIERA